MSTPNAKRSINNETQLAVLVVHAHDPRDALGQGDRSVAAPIVCEVPAQDDHPVFDVDVALLCRLDK